MPRASVRGTATAAEQLVLLCCARAIFLSSQSELIFGLRRNFEQ
jgi:hypothetical protein